MLVTGILLLFRQYVHRTDPHHLCDAVDGRPDQGNAGFRRGNGRRSPWQHPCHRHGWGNLPTASAIRAVIIGAALAVSALRSVPQAFVTDAWQLIGLRFLMGLALGGLLPCITSVIRHNVPDRVAGGILAIPSRRNMWGKSQGRWRRLCRRPFRHARRLPRHLPDDGGRRDL